MNRTPRWVPRQERPSQVRLQSAQDASHGRVHGARGVHRGGDSLAYGLYAWIAFYLPNRVYNAQLREMNEERLHHSIENVLLYASLELLSLVVLQFVLRRKFRISPLHQLAFVLDTQWTLVQFKLCTWFLYSIQFSIEHFGADYSFKFTWLH
ncbi:hypothetical protein Poli38472_005230 [Pythium oligandrum]|uniref:Uncharacterized protein n=1 Tax=Pythium oligandrum TaxID=41045 RepID=A0A8K1FKA2_PYTOL|nr:hypothetical protein Poli38472_005230 [Pythium oligandrum]|eukprot:TMW62612.1 hypothetical protein Poli38472_005230 [Pythium oligandrum]